MIRSLTSGSPEKAFNQRLRLIEQLGFAGCLWVRHRLVVGQMDVDLVNRKRAFDEGKQCLGFACRHRRDGAKGADCRVLRIQAPCSAAVAEVVPPPDRHAVLRVGRRAPESVDPAAAARDLP